MNLTPTKLKLIKKILEIYGNEPFRFIDIWHYSHEFENIGTNNTRKSYLYELMGTVIHPTDPPVTAKGAEKKSTYGVIDIDRILSNLNPIEAAKWRKAGIFNKIFDK